jgi:hypothetical protein
MKKILLIITLILSKFVSLAQASLEVKNNSMRYMTVKVMRANGGISSLFKTIKIAPHSNETIYFSNSGKYFTKTKAVINGKNPVCRKGQMFNVVNDATGYSVLTLTFSIRESSTPQSSGGQSISEEEFNSN